MTRSRHRRRPVQLEFPVRGRGGWRPGAGRPRTSTSVPHRARPPLASRHPVHVTLRALSGLPSMRRAHAGRALRGALRAGCDRFGFRLVHFSVQTNHVHILCEAKDAHVLSRGLRGLAIRLARAFNRAHARRGRVWADRYHAHILRTPRETRAALSYVFGNWRHHGGERYPRGCLDPLSSAPFFGGFIESVLPPAPGTAPPVVPPRTWLLCAGWKRAGPLSVDAAPWPS